MKNKAKEQKLIKIKIASLINEGIEEIENGAKGVELDDFLNSIKKKYDRL